LTTPGHIVDSTVAFLKGHEPFARMAAKDLRFLAEHARLGYFPVGSMIIDPARGRTRDLHIIRRGHVRNYNPVTEGDDGILVPGECFPVAALAASSVGSRCFIATEDVFCFLVPEEQFNQLRASSAPFAEFCTQALASIVQQSLGQLRRVFNQRATEQHTLLEPVSRLVRRAPVYCSLETPVRTALQTMSEEKIGTIAVVNDKREPVGIFTLTDLLDRVVLRDVDLATPVSEVMTEAPGMIDESATAEDAMALMAQRGYHQLMLTRDRELTGVVSERDLFAMQRVSMRGILQAIRLARDEEGLGRVVPRIGELTDNLIAQGARAELLTQTITSVNDALTHRLFALLEPRFDLAGIEWCWLSLGSEGRSEQTIATDQDNALIFRSQGGAVDEARRRLLDFGQAVNRALADLGFPLCAGGIMGGNPAWCLSTEEWRGKFGAWIREPTPEALLNANIFFDFRPLTGDSSLALELREWLTGVIPGNRLFLGILVANALQAEPPLGVIRAFRTESDDGKGTIDLKTHGTRIFVDAARAFALGLGIGETNTSRRLRATGSRLNLDQRETAATVEAFQFLQMLRLRVQRDLIESDGDHNRLDPYALNELDQRVLRESLRQARGLQRNLEIVLGH
jgi:CBS domain-containing protein